MVGVFYSNYGVKGRFSIDALLLSAYEAIGRYIYTYNFERCHQSIGNKHPAEVYYPAMLLDEARAAA